MSQFGNLLLLHIEHFANVREVMHKAHSTDFPKYCNEMVNRVTKKNSVNITEIYYEHKYSIVFQ